MDVRFINPFIKSLCNTYKTMCNLSVTVGSPELKTDDNPRSDVSSVIGFSGDAAGCVVLHYSLEMASRDASSFAGTEVTPRHEDFADAIGELANMVAEGAKAQLHGLDIRISLPNVIVGENHNVSASKATPRIVIPCTTAHGTFQMEIGMTLEKSHKLAAPESIEVGARA